MSFLLTGDGRESQRSKLEFRFDPKQALSTPNKAGGGLQEDIPGFDTLDDLIFVSGIGQFQLVLKIKITIGIPVDIDLHFVPNRSGNSQPQIHPKLGCQLCSSPNDGLLCSFLVDECGSNICTSIDAEVHFIFTKNGGKTTLAASRHRD